MDFYDYATMYDQIDSKGVPWQECYKRALTNILEEGLQARTRRGPIPGCFNQIEAERHWYLHGKPYYKLYPDLLPWIYEAARLDVPNELLHLPFSTILLRFPQKCKFDFLTVDDQYFVRSILISEAREGIIIDLPTSMSSKSNNITIWVDFGEIITIEGLPTHVSTYQRLDFHQNMTIEESLRIAQLKTDTDVPGIAIPQEIMKNCLHICAATCFLATGADKIVEEDVLNKDILKFIQAQLDGDGQKQKQLHKKAKQRGKFGWTIGRNKELIFPSRSRQNKDSQETGRELNFQHQRSGHFHVVRYGSGKGQTRVQWYRQLTVRPDLPPHPNPKRGYKTR